MNSEHCQIFKVDHFAKRIILEYSAGTQPEIFQGRRGFVELGHPDKHFIKNTGKEGPSGKHFGVFPPRYYKNYILNGKFTQKYPSSYTPVSVAEYASISLNIPKYP